MMFMSSKSQIPELGEIVRLIAAERRSHSMAVQTRGGVQKLINWVSELWMHLEYLAELRLAHKQEHEIARYAHDLREAYDGHSWSLDRTEMVLERDAVIETGCMKAFFPSMLRRGAYYTPCDLHDDTSAPLVRSLGWRYLAALHVLDKLTALNSQGLDTMLGETEHLLVRAAKAQRRLRSCVLAPAATLAGELTALAVAPGNDKYFNSYLVSVNEFTAGSMAMGAVVARAKNALDTAQGSIRHNILITDDIGRDSELDGTYCQHDHRIHLVGDPSDLKYFIFVSDVPDHNRPFDSAPFSEGRFRVSRSRLRDAFLGKAEELSDPGANKRSHSGWTKPFAPNVVRFPSPPVAEKVTLAEVHDDEPVLRGRIARVFFGYKGLPDIDPV
jgi:hypothetical protein